MTVSLAVCEICNVKEWRDHENWVRGRSRSLKMALFDRSYTTFYWSAVVTITLLSCIMCQFGLAVCGHVGVTTQASGVLFITRGCTCVCVRVPAVVSRMLLVDGGGRV